MYHLAFKRTLGALALIAAGAVPVLSTAASAQSQGLAGSYLAARSASFANDFETAADFFVRALVRDPSNAQLMENAMSALVAVGRVERAVPIARQMVATGTNSQTAAQILIAHRISEGQFDAALADIDAGLSIGPLVDGLISAWAEVGGGRMTEALRLFDELSAQSGLAAFGAYHKGLALASVGDFEGAEAIFAAGDGAQLQRTRRGVIAHAAMLSQLDQPDAALDVISTAFGGASDPGVDEVIAKLEAGQAVDYSLATSAAEGVAEVFFSIGTALSGEANDAYTLGYVRIAEFLRPTDTDTILLAAGLLERLEQFELATETYDRVSRDSPVFYDAEIGRSEALRLAGRPEAAIEVLEQLAESHGDISLVHQTLGDTLRRLERYEDAILAYDRAIALVPNPEPRNWGVYFTRGIAMEREDRWDEAEADFRFALELNPDQPQVLNYLGYSMVELEINLDEALSMIERAVAARPNDGYITDSLGWVLYRMGRYDEAVALLERATELTPIDPIINDHLGDAFWAVGRQLEARFQWRRALSFDPEEDEALRIKRKIEIGLDEVLAEEGEEPLSVANDEG